MQLNIRRPVLLLGSCIYDSPPIVMQGSLFIWFLLRFKLNTVGDCERVSKQVHFKDVVLPGFVELSGRKAQLKAFVNRKGSI